MSGDVRRPTRPSASSRPLTAPKLRQGNFLTPRLAGTEARDKSLDSERVSAPRLARRLSGEQEKTTISPNVTPRSIARRSRLDDTTTTTPDLTPSSTPTPSVVAPRLRQSQARVGRRSSKSDVGSSSGGMGGQTRRKSKETDGVQAQFFLASDAPAKRRSKSPSSQSMVSTFVYADGREGPRRLGKQDDRRVSRSPGPRSVVGDMATQPTKRRISSRSSPAVSRTPLEARSIPAAINHPALGLPAPDLRILSRTIRGAATRSKSPLKKFEMEHVPSAGQRRRSSIDTSPEGSRQASGVYGQPPTDTSLPPSQSQSVHPLMTQSMPQLPGLTTPLSPITIQSPPTLAAAATLFSVPTSPTKGPDSGGADTISSVVADARRDRKILDLEISNSSLLAFNRSLERDNRKLKADLRRYRRMTSNGAVISGEALSPPFTASIDGDHEQASGAEDGDQGGGRGGGGGGGGGEDGGGGAEREAEDSDWDSPSDLSEGQLAERDAKDRRRLRRDIARHKQLLDDSRRMNVSIKRCMDVTDQLIADARRALAHQVELTDDDHYFRGRVLQADEMDDDPGQARGLLSPVKEANIIWAGHET